MRGILLATAAVVSMTLTGCNNGKLAVRAVGKSQLSEQATASVRIAEGNAQLALGNTGLAVESFRKALREDPSLIDGYTGLAVCYERMGRFDLAAHQVELALALQPENLALLERLAANLMAEGDTDKANAVRREMAMRAALAETGAPAADSVARAVSIDERLTVSNVMPVTSAPVPTSNTPRLVRLSRGEIALVTGPGALWEKAIAAQPRTVRSHQIELLNAARVDQLASRTRKFAEARGWSNVTVGNAPAIRRDSVILFPASARLGAARLSAQLGMRTQLDPARSHITVILGQDAPKLIAGSAKGA